MSSFVIGRWAAALREQAIKSDMTRARGYRSIDERPPDPLTSFPSRVPPVDLRFVCFSHSSIASLHEGWGG